jgi:hypothetical protein
MNVKKIFRFDIFENADQGLDEKDNVKVVKVLFKKLLMNISN